MRVTTRDPITGNDVQDRDTAPFVVEGQGEGALLIYFESEQNRKAYLEVPVRVPTTRSVELYRQIKDRDKVMWDTVLWD